MAPLDLKPINQILQRFDSSGDTMSASSVNNMFPSFLDNSPNPNSMSSAPRLPPSPVNHGPQQHQTNGANGAAMNGMSGFNMGMPMNAGHQMDVNLLYQRVLELSDLLKENREKTQGIIAGAEELATRAAANGASPSIQDANAEITAARITDLERQLSHEQKKVATLIREQKENTKLIGEYETAVGNIVEMVRNYSYNNKTEKTAVAVQYNTLLQEEKDAHLAARLEKDDWHTKAVRCAAMLREAYRLRCEEDEIPIRVVSGLQNEVRAYRNALGMEPEKPEEEYGYEVLKYVIKELDER